jgi:hypothetical protein
MLPLPSGFCGDPAARTTTMKIPPRSIPSSTPAALVLLDKLAALDADAQRGWVAGLSREQAVAFCWVLDRNGDYDEATLLEAHVHVLRFVRDIEGAWPFGGPDNG